MRALSVAELGFVSGGNVNGPAVTSEGWSQLGAIENVIVTAARKIAGGGLGDWADHSIESGSFDDHWTSRASQFGGITMNQEQINGLLEVYSSGMGALGGGMLGAIADARMGAAIGSVAGPTGALVGGLAGALIGYLAFVYASNGYSWSPPTPSA